MNTVKIDIDVYIDMLYDRYNNVPDNWKNEATDSLFEDLIEMIKDCPPSSQNSDPKYIIDNYCINGCFKSKEDYSDEEWEELDALLKNEKYACLRF